MSEPDLFESLEETAARHAAEQSRLRELDDLRHVLTSVEGRRHTWRQLAASGVLQQVFCGEETHRTAFRDGNRMHGLKLFADIMECVPERYAEMMSEAAADPAVRGTPPTDAEKT